MKYSLMVFSFKVWNRQVNQGGAERKSGGGLIDGRGVSIPQRGKSAVEPQRAPATQD